MTFTSPPTTALQPGDAELIERAVKGDQKAFSQLVNRYLPLVYNYLYRMTQNHEVSEEMAQEAFVKAYQNLKSFDQSRNFKPWILRIASNAAISQIRKQSRLVSLNALEEEGVWGEAEHQTSEDIVTQLERKLSAQEVLKALGTLDDKYRQALLLRYQQELSYEEIADALGIPLNTVRTWIKRGMDKLRNEVKEMAL
ncbi:RNA polymerase sigma factor [Vampirovibrio sp.]|uniref:RNA polymerase sigma factor n=1 Tax=Vampirovibrio sp. TaxID=2717857 RepID=UPI0035935C91